MLKLRVSKSVLLIIVLLNWTSVYGQEVIELINPSFEGLPHQGAKDINVYSNSGFGAVNPFSAINKWTDCGFKNETPPDLHGINTGFFNVFGQPYEGKTFMGMVVRYNETYERISQKLSAPLKAGKCYKFSIYLARNLYYKSHTQVSLDVQQSFSKPCVLRIMGGNGYCSTKEMLGESVAVQNTDWRRYDFILKPKKEWGYIELQAFYKTPVLFPYNGNILLDAASDIVEIPCPEAPVLAAVPQMPEDKAEEKKMAVNQDPSGELQKELEERIARAKEKDVNFEVPDKMVTENIPPPSEKKEDSKPKILDALDANKIEEGQVIQIEKLYFDADKADVQTKSFAVLDEVFDFLSKNQKVIVEIGGHTNGKPRHEYCDKLSLARAESVAKYLIDKGIADHRIKAKGYGKRQPIDKRTNHYSHQRNQRVEVKILSLSGQNG